MNDRHTIDDATRVLDGAGFKWRRLGKDAIMAQCPRHHGGDMNCQISLTKDERLYAYCYSQCGEGYFLDEEFESLRKEWEGETTGKLKVKETTYETKEKDYRRDNMYEYWETLGYLPSEPIFKGIDNEELEELGWRWVAGDTKYSLGTGCFIPYWGANKGEDKTLYFAQVRHLEGPIRFNFAKDYKPTVYGKWILQLLAEDPEEDRLPILFVEGTSDWVVLNHCGIPVVGFPSASSTELCKEVSKWCKDKKIGIIYAGDNDEAGDKLRAAIDEAGIPYRIKQPPNNHKDWKDFFVAEGEKAVIDYLFPTIFPPEPQEIDPSIKNVMDIMGGGTILKVKEKEQPPRQGKLDDYRPEIRYFEIWEPRWHDKTVLLDSDKILNMNIITFTKVKDDSPWAGRWSVPGEVAKQYDGDSNGKIQCCAVPLDKLVKET